MRFSRLGIFTLIVLSVFLTTNCSYYNRIMSRKNLVDGSVAYKERKFQVAEELFRKAADRDPDGATVEGRTAQIFLARTLHSMYIGNRKDVDIANEAIVQYQKALSVNKSDQSSYKAVAGLYENLQKPDEWLKWVNARANDTTVEPQYRAEAFTSLAAKKNTCANEVTDTEKTKKTVKKDGKDVYQFVKPEDPAELERLKGCVTEGNALIKQAVDLEPDTVKNAKSLNVKTLTDEQLKTTSDTIKAFESARSYKASLGIQAMRLAEMEGNTAERDKLKTEADQAKEQFTQLSDMNKSFQTEIDARKAALEQAANANAANAANANKK